MTRVGSAITLLGIMLPGSDDGFRQIQWELSTDQTSTAIATRIPLQRTIHKATLPRRAITIPFSFYLSQQDFHLRPHCVMLFMCKWQMKSRNLMPQRWQ